MFDVSLYVSFKEILNKIKKYRHTRRRFLEFSLIIVFYEIIML